MPVHLGSMPLSVKAAIDRFKPRPGDIFIINDPYSGGTHLPDITLIAPVFQIAGKKERLLFFVASRAHHADVGGMSPGSMPLSSEIFQEGIRIPPLKLYSGGRLDRNLLKFLLFNVRTPFEREGDLAAQVGSLRIGERRLLEMVEKNGVEEVQSAVSSLITYAENAIRKVIEELPDGIYTAEDFLDDDGVNTSVRSKPVRIRVKVQVEGQRMKVDFTGSDPQVSGCLNAVYAVTLSAVHYVLRCLVEEDIPISAGVLRVVDVIAPEGTIVNACFPAAMAAGNVETSQRIVDVFLKAMSAALTDKIPAASSGTMNNISIGGTNPETGKPFSYYETIGGGMGGSPTAPGDSGVHTHMTNSLNTPIEALERYYPIRVREYRIRRGSGGTGKHRGGDGIIRSLETLTECQMTVLSERRKQAPFGLAGGSPGKKGMNSLESGQGRKKRLHGKFSQTLQKGDLDTARLAFDHALESSLQVGGTTLGGHQYVLPKIGDRGLRENMGGATSAKQEVDFVNVYQEVYVGCRYSRVIAIISYHYLYWYPKVRAILIQEYPARYIIDLGKICPIGWAECCHFKKAIDIS